MATAAVNQQTKLQNQNGPVLFYIVAPLMLWAIHWVLLAEVVQAPMQLLIIEAQRLITSILFAFLLALYASRASEARDWRSFSRWFGAFALLNPIVQPISFSLLVFEIFEIAKRRVRAHPVLANS